jgi:hypothetical protein
MPRETKTLKIWIILLLALESAVSHGVPLSHLAQKGRLCAELKDSSKNRRIPSQGLGHGTSAALTSRYLLLGDYMWCI